MPNLAERVLDHLRQHGPSRAEQIAAALGAERTAVNSTLNRVLSGRVLQGNDYVWSLAGMTAGEAPSNGRSGNAVSSLMSYYLDCLSFDDDGGVQVFADSKFDLDYVELESWPLDGMTRFKPSELLRKLIARQRRSSQKNELWLGYPTILRRVRFKRGGEVTFLQPVFLW